MSRRTQCLCGLGGLLAGLMVAARPVRAAPVEVIKRPADVSTRYFDPKDPPPEMPKLKPGEAALCHCEFTIDANGNVRILRQQPGPRGTVKATVEVANVRVTLGLRIVIWLPRNPTKKLIAHEEGHRRIAEIYYQDAQKIATAVHGKLVGQVLTGEGRDAQSAARQAVQEALKPASEQYLQQTDGVSGQVHTLYDELTRHGTNNMPEEQAIQTAIKRQRENAVHRRDAEDAERIERLRD